MGASLTLQSCIVASVAGLYGVNVAGHNPELDHITGFQVVRVDRSDTEKVSGFVYDVHMGFVRVCGVVGKLAVD